MQTKRWSKTIKALKKPEEFCKRLQKMVQYMQYLRLDWEEMNKIAKRLTEERQQPEDFRKWYEEKMKPQNVDWGTHDEDPLDCK